MVATAVALAALGLKSLDSGRSDRGESLPSLLGSQIDVAWPTAGIGPDSP